MIHEKILLDPCLDLRKFLGRSCQDFSQGRNLFRVPPGRAGKQFISELARLFREYANDSMLEGIALKAAMIMPSLLLQRPHRNSKLKENISNLERRLTLWIDGQITTLLSEGKTIQNRLVRHSISSNGIHQDCRAFELVMQGKVNSAIRLLDSSPAGGVLRLIDSCGGGNQTVRDCLIDKHPPAQSVDPSMIVPVSPNFDDFHPIIFDSITGSLIKSIALSTQGAAGPSWADAADWRRFCSCFKKSSDDLCSSLAAVARKLCTRYIDPVGISAFISGRLIALDKQPGVRPIGIGEVSRRIIGKAVLHTIKTDIQEVAGSLQLCAGQPAGCEAAVHAARQLYSEDDTQGILLVDATNAFNSLNRQLALINISHLCPVFSRFIVNTYRSAVNMYIDGECIISSEGTTQGDPVAMAMYALATVPLINRLHHLVHQIWYADDAAACGFLAQLKHWWDLLNQIGPSFGYYPNASKTHLIVKPSYLSSAEELFSGSSVIISDRGHKYLGSAIGTTSFVEAYVNEKVKNWEKELLLLSSFAESQPHSTFAVFTHGLYSKWNYIFRTVPNMSNLLKPLENIISSKFIPSLTGQGVPSHLERDLFTLPARLGGLGLFNPVQVSDLQFNNSLSVTAPLVDLILRQDCEYSYEVFCSQLNAKSEVKKNLLQSVMTKSAQLSDLYTDDLARAVHLAKLKGASSWLTISDHDFALHKSAFRDALALRYGWLPARLPLKCICGEDFTVDHAMNCPHGGLPSLRHNELRDFTSSLLSEICSDVSIEPELQPLTGESMNLKTANVTDEARLDVKARGFWGSTSTKDYFDIKVFNPHARSYRNCQIQSFFFSTRTSKKKKL